MRKAATAWAIGTAALGLAAPAAAGPIEVTRFHLGVPVAPGAVAVERASGGGTPSTELAAYLDAVHRELGRVGFGDADAAQPSQYVATVDVLRGSRDLFDQRPAGAGMPAHTVRGARRSATISELSVQMKRRADGSLVWEGRAQTADRVAPGRGAALAPRLAHALFQGFPGKSGMTITLP